MILLSNGGTNQHRNRQHSDTMAIGTVDGGLYCLGKKS